MTSTLNQALQYYIDDRQKELKSAKEKGRHFPSYNSFFGYFGRYDAESKIQAAQNVIDDFSSAIEISLC